MPGTWRSGAHELFDAGPPDGHEGEFRRDEVGVDAYENEYGGELEQSTGGIHRIRRLTSARSARPRRLNGAAARGAEVRPRLRPPATAVYLCGRARSRAGRIADRDHEGAGDPPRSAPGTARPCTPWCHPSILLAARWSRRRRHIGGCGLSDLRIRGRSCPYEHSNSPIITSLGHER